MGIWKAQIIRWAALVLLVLFTASPVQAESVSAVRAGLSAPHVLRDAAARQRPPLKVHRRSGTRASSTATKVTAGFAMGLVGFFSGMFVAYLVQVARNAPGDGRTAEMTGGIVGGAAGAIFGVWLAR